MISIYDTSPVHIGLRFGHHAGHSGYHRLSEYVGDVKVVNDAFADERVNVPRTSLGFAGKISTAVRGRVRPTEIGLLPAMLFGGVRVYHFLYAENSYFYSAMAGSQRAKIVCSFHQPEIWFRTKWKGIRSSMVRHAYRRIGIAVALGASQVDILSEIVGEGRVEIIHHGVDTEFFSPGGGLPTQPVILTVGSWLRNFELLNSVARRVLELRPDVRFRIVASGPASKMQFPPNVELMSGISDEDLLHQYRSASVLYLPLKGSVANNALLEGMAVGVPILVSRTGDVEEYAGTDSGSILDGDDVDAHVLELFRMLDDSEFSERASRGARRRAEQLSWTQTGQKMQALYSRLIAND